MVIKNIILRVSSVYVPWSGLSDMANDKLYKTFLSGSANVRDDCILFSLGNINGHVDQLRAGYYGLYGGFCFGDRNAEGK